MVKTEGRLGLIRFYAKSVMVLNGGVEHGHRTVSLHIVNYLSVHSSLYHEDFKLDH